MGEVASLSLPCAPSHVSNPVAVIIAPGKFTKTISEVGKTAKMFQCRYMGRAQEVAAFVAMLFNEGLLGEMLLAPHQPAAPEVASTRVEVQLEAGTDIHAEADTDIGDEVSTVPESEPDMVSTAPGTVPHTKLASEADTDIGDEASVVARSTDSELCGDRIHQVVEKRIRLFAKKEAAITKLEKRPPQKTCLNADEEKKLSTGPTVREVLSELKEFQSVCEGQECDAIVDRLRRQIRKLSKKQGYDKASEFETLVLEELRLVEKYVLDDQDA